MTKPLIQGTDLFTILSTKRCPAVTAPSLCPEQDSNLHASRHTHLKRARLPFRHLGKYHEEKNRETHGNRLCLALCASGKRDSNSRPQPWQGCALPTELFPHRPYVKRRRLELPRLAALPPQSSASTIPPPLHLFRHTSNPIKSERVAFSSFHNFNGQQFPLLS